MLHYRNLMTLPYMFLTSTLQKMKYIRSNNCDFMTEKLRKAILNRSKLRNSFLKTRNEEPKRRFNYQNKFVSLLRKPKRRFFGKLDHRVVFDNRKFWKAVSSVFLERAFHKKSIILNNNNKTVNNNEKLRKIFNKYFSQIVVNLDIDKTLASNVANSDIDDFVFNAIKKYEVHPRLSKIIQDLQFSFNFETQNKILAKIHSLNNKKVCQESNIPVKITKDSIDIFSEFIFHNFNNSIFDATFLSELIYSDVIPVFKKKDRVNRVYKYFNHILSKWQYGFLKGFST